jgi:hypothetical protein
MRAKADNTISFGVALDDFEYRRALDFALGEEFSEDRRLENAESDIEPDPDEEEAEKERYPPAPGEELLSGHLAKREDGEVGEEKPAGHAELRPGGDEAAGMIGASPFHRHQHRAAPLAADPDPLDEAQDGEDDRPPDADLLIGRHQRHRESGQAHEQQRRDQRRLSTDAIAVMAEDRRTYRPRDEAHGIDGKGLERSDPGVRVREEQLGEDKAGDGAVEKEIVPLDGGANGGRDNGAAELHLMFGRRKLKGGDIGRNHGHFSRTPLRGREQRSGEINLRRNSRLGPRVPGVRRACP